MLDQRQLDILGLALIAFGILIAIPLYRAGTGGVLGEGVADGARILLGSAALGAPLLAIAGGLVAVSPISVAATIRIGAGGLSAFGAVALISRAAAGPDDAARWDTPHLRGAGGALGETLWSICNAAFGSFGPYVVAVVLILVAALLLTGAEVASVARGAGRGLRGPSRRPASCMRSARRRARWNWSPGVRPWCVPKVGRSGTGRASGTAPTPHAAAIPREALSRRAAVTSPAAATPRRAAAAAAAPRHRSPRGSSRSILRAPGPPPPTTPPPAPSPAPAWPRRRSPASIRSCVARPARCSSSTAPSDS